MEDLRDEKYLTAPVRLENKAYIEGRLNEVLMTDSADNWLKKLEARRIPCARVNNLAQALSDPQVRHRNMVVDVAHPEGGSTEVPGNPIKMSNMREETFTPPPLLGAQTREVFREWTAVKEDAIQTGIDQGYLA